MEVRRVWAGEGGINGRLRVTCWAAFAALLTVGIISAPALAEFRATVTVSKTGAGVSDSQGAPWLAVDANGDALITWMTDPAADYRLQARTLSAAGTLGPVRTVVDPISNIPGSRIAVNAGGDAVVGWTTVGRQARYVAQARTLSAAGTFGPILTLSNPHKDTFTPQVAIDAKGNAVFAWHPFETGLYAQTLSASGALGPVLKIDTNWRADGPIIAIDADGNGAIVWSHVYQPPQPKILARRLSTAGALGPVQIIAEGDPYASQVVVLSGGDAVIVWTSNGQIQARTLSAASVLGPVRTLFAAGLGYDAEAAIDAHGDAVIVWQFVDAADRSWIQARSLSAAGVLGPVQTLSTAKEYASRPQVAVDADGDAAIIWQRYSGTGNRIEARTRSATGALGPVQILSNTAAIDQHVAVGAGGHAVVVWRSGDLDEVTSRIKAAVGP